MLKRLLNTILCSVLALGVLSSPTSAQVNTEITPNATDEAIISTLEGQLASDEARIASLSAQEQERIQQLRREDITKPEEAEQKEGFLVLFNQRPASELNWYNVMAYTVQHAVSVGVPANTIMLILLLPFLATFIAFVRHVIGLPTIGMFVPIAFSITLVATGVTAGLVLLVSILIGSTVAKLLLKKVRIMQLPKVALSMAVVSISIFITLLFSAQAGILAVRNLSIFPVLLLILLSEQIVALQLRRSFVNTVMITLVTLAVGGIGYVVFASEFARNTILLYPELILLLIPTNILIGRYYGLRLTEYYRFHKLIDADK